MKYKEYKELMEAYNKLEKECMQLKKKLEEVQGEKQKGKIWQPKTDEKYWAKNGYKETCCYTNEEHTFDKGFISIGKCYPTEEKAEFEANREKYTRLFRQYVEQHSEPLDWKDCVQKKWYICCDRSIGEIFLDYGVCTADAFQMYASSEEVLQEAIDFIGEDNFKKYILEVE